MRTSFTHLLDGNEVTISSNKASYPSAPERATEVVYPLVLVISGKFTSDDSSMLAIGIACSDMVIAAESPSWFDDGAANERLDWLFSIRRSVGLVRFKNLSMRFLSSCFSARLIVALVTLRLC